MSHISTIEIEVRDKECLEKAAKRLGLQVREKKTYRWYGRSVGDYPMPKGFKEEDLGKCDFALGIDKNDAYEVGVVKNADGNGYTLLWDFWNKGYGLQAAIGENGTKLQQAYAVEVALKQAYREGYAVTESLAEDGSIVLNAVQY